MSDKETKSDCDSTVCGEDSETDRLDRDRYLRSQLRLCWRQRLLLCLEDDVEIGLQALAKDGKVDELGQKIKIYKQVDTLMECHRFLKNCPDFD